MAIEVLANSDDNQAIMFCNTTGWAFGPVHRSSQRTSSATAEMYLFIRFLGRDAREYEDLELEGKYYDFRQLVRTCRCGEPYLHINNSTKCDDCKQLEDDDT